MGSKQEIVINFSKFLWEKNLSVNLKSVGFNIKKAKNYSLVVFDWTDVRFFDDICLLKLLIIEHHLRTRRVTVNYRGLDIVPTAGILWQIWQSGLPELFSSDLLFSGNDYRSNENLFSSDPNQWYSEPLPSSNIMKLVCCHNQNFFRKTSRAYKRMEEFDHLWQHQHFAGQSDPDATGWELLNNGDFRRLLFEQTRLNVLEHSRGTLGLAMARIIEPQKFQEQWLLTTEDWKEFLQEESPLIEILKRKDDNSAFLQILTLDDGAGISKSKIRRKTQSKANERILTLKDKHDSFLRKDGDLFAVGRVYRENDLSLFAEQTGLWVDLNAAIISFATDEKHGSSKVDRLPYETQGLAAIVKLVRRNKEGYLRIESCGSTVTFKCDIQRYGNPEKTLYDYCPKGGTCVHALLPLGQKIEIHGISSHAPLHLPTDTSGLHDDNRIKVMFEKKETPEDAAERIIKRILRKDGAQAEYPFVLDWSEFKSDKDAFVELMHSLADQLRKNRQGLSPFVFANFPWNMKGFLNRTTEYFSAIKKQGLKAIPVCVFVDSASQWYWLGLDHDEVTPQIKLSALKSLFEKDQRSKKTVQDKCKPSLKLTCKNENTVEAYFRFWFNRMLERPRNNKYASGLEDRTKASTDIRRELLELFRDCPYLFEEGATILRMGNENKNELFRPLYSAQEIQEAVTGTFIGKLNQTIKDAEIEVVFEKGLRLNSKQIVKEYYRCDKLVDSHIAEELCMHLVERAYTINQLQSNGEKIDFVLSCTSPTHWFVHKLVDGLSNTGLECGHFVFSRPGMVATEIKNTCIGEGNNVLVFTDCISTGSLVMEMVDAIKKQNAKVAGIIALIDTRDKPAKVNMHSLALKEYEDVTSIFISREVRRYDKDKFGYTHVIDEETATPKQRFMHEDVESYYENKLFSGHGKAFESFFYHKEPKLLLKQICHSNALKAGHFQHGVHHSEIFCDIRKAFQNRQGIFNHVIRAIIHYIIEHEIEIVIYPNHSNAYMLRDELETWLRSAPKDCDFITATKVSSPRTSSAYIITTLSPKHNPKGHNDKQRNVLVIDDGICSAETIRSMIAAFIECQRPGLVDITQNAAIEEEKRGCPSELRLHIIAFIDRLPVNHQLFWEQLSYLSETMPKYCARQVRYSRILTLPVRTYNKDDCPLCRKFREFVRRSNDTRRSHYEMNFYYKWKCDLEPVDPYEHKSVNIYKQVLKFSSEEILKIISIFEAFEEKEPEYYVEKMKQCSLPLKLYIHSRLSSISNIYHLNRDKAFENFRHLIADVARQGSSEDRLELLRFVVNEEMVDSFEIERMTTLGKLLFEYYSKFVGVSDIAGGLAAFCNATMETYERDINEIDDDRVRSEWSNFLLELIKKTDGDTNKQNLSWLRLHLLDPLRTPRSVERSVVRLLSYGRTCTKPYHPTPCSILEETKTKLNKFAENQTLKALGSDAFSKEPEDDTALSEVESLIDYGLDVFNKVVSAIEIIRFRCSLDNDEISPLLSSRKILQTIKDNIAIVSASKNTKSSNSFQAFEQIAASFNRIYNTLFSLDYGIMDAIAFWSSSPYDICKDCVKDIGNDKWIKGITYGEKFKQNEHVKVLCKDALLRDIVNHLLENIKKHRINPSDEVAIEFDMVSTSDDKITLFVSNTLTQEENKQPNSFLNLKKKELAEYGALLTNENSDKWTYVAKLEMLIYKGTQNENLDCR